MRIFVGIDLDPEVRSKIQGFIEGVEGFAPEARWIKAESLHITLKFIGEQPPEEVEAIADALQAIKEKSFELDVAECGFFPTVKAPRVFWIGVRQNPLLAELATKIDTVLRELGIAREERSYSPHLTLARGGAKRSSGSPNWREGDRTNCVFSTLQKRLATMATMATPDFGTFAVREFILYRSQLSPSGSKYSKLREFSLQSG